MLLSFGHCLLNDNTQHFKFGYFNPFSPWIDFEIIKCRTYRWTVFDLRISGLGNDYLANWATIPAFGTWNSLYSINFALYLIYPMTSKAQVKNILFQLLGNRLLICFVVMIIFNWFHLNKASSWTINNDGERLLEEQRKQLRRNCKNRLQSLLSLKRWRHTNF